MRSRTLTATAAIVIGALVVPSVVLERVPAVWAWLASWAPGTLPAAEGRLRATPREDAEIVVLGSSVAVYDVYDEVLTEALDRPVVNAGIMAASVCTSAMFVDDVIERRPRTVAFVMGPRDLEVCKMREGGGSPFDLDVAWHAAGLELVTDEEWLATALGGTSVLVRYRRLPQLMIEGRHTPGWRFHPRFGTAMHGPALEARAERVAARIRDATYDGESPSVRALERFVARVRATGTEVVLVPAPTHPRVVELATGQVGTAWHEGQIRSMRRVAERLDVRFAPPEALGDYPAGAFLDTSHLGPRGQAPYTRALAAALR
ncbi:MAG: hypothetical protein KC619_19915 [Myxococcales bacterium]|nr:hypothetical protein [Myxococcales bacterium]